MVGVHLYVFPINLFFTIYSFLTNSIVPLNRLLFVHEKNVIHSGNSYMFYESGISFHLRHLTHLSIKKKIHRKIDNYARNNYNIHSAIKYIMLQFLFYEFFIN